MNLRAIFFASALLVFPQVSFADATGEWRVADGAAHIKIDDCGGRMWGIVSWAQQHGTDVNNPDPAKRNRSTLGMPIILGMQPTRPNRWEGEIYNAQNGKTYSGSITLTGPDELRIDGCVLGFFCGGQNWTRVKAEQSGAAAPAGRKTAARKPGDTSPDVCSSVGGGGAGTTGSAHQRRLK
jgi:uncharacterized protein (DUF2147 family)